MNPSGAYLDFRFRVYHAEHGNASQDIQRFHRRHILHACPFDWDQEVQWNGVNLFILECKCKFHALFHGFAHAQDSAGTYFQPGFSRGVKGFDAVGISMRGADIREEAPGSFEVVMETFQARRFQLSELFNGKRSKRGAPLNVFLPEIADSFADLFNAFIVQ